METPNEFGLNSHTEFPAKPSNEIPDGMPKANSRWNVHRQFLTKSSEETPGESPEETSGEILSGNFWKNTRRNAQRELLIKSPEETPGGISRGNP